MQFFVWKYKYATLFDEVNGNLPRFGIHLLDEVFQDEVNANDYCSEQTKSTGFLYYVVKQSQADKLQDLLRNFNNMYKQHLYAHNKE